MALILNIETATNNCSVALSRDGNILSFKENNYGQSHARLLTTLIKNCCDESDVELKTVDAVSVSKGPGSFTGLRIGVATAKGICYAIDKPLLSVNTLQSMAAFLKSTTKIDDEILLCPMIDARRMEVYTAVFNSDFEFIHETQAMILNENSFKDLLSKQKMYFFGDGAEKAKTHVEKRDYAIFGDAFTPSARGMVPFSEKAYNSKIFEIVAYFEPFYLKDFYSPGQPL